MLLHHAQSIEQTVCRNHYSTIETIPLKLFSLFEQTKDVAFLETKDINSPIFLAMYRAEACRQRSHTVHQPEEEQTFPNGCNFVSAAPFSHQAKIVQLYTYPCTT